MERLGIVYYLDKYPKLSQSFVLNEIVELKRQGNDVAVFSLFEPEENITHVEYNKFDLPVYRSNPSYKDVWQLASPIIRYFSNIYTATSLSLFSPKTLAKNALFGIQCAKFINRLDFTVDVIHGHFANSNKLGSIFASNYHSIPCTVTAHAYEIFRSPNVAMIKYICDQMDHVIVPSEYNMNYLQNEIQVTNEMTIVPATTKIDKFNPVSDPVPGRILTIARLVEKKGIEYAIDAVRMLIDQGHDVNYHIIGRGKREESLRQRVLDRGIEDHVTFLGHVSDERLKIELSEACLFLLPCVVASDGDRDAMPVVLKEAMAAQTACVSTTVSAIPELITDGKDGRLVPPEDPKAIADVAGDLLKNENKRNKLAQNGRETVETKFDISTSVADLMKVFKGCSESKKAY